MPRVGDEEFAYTDEGMAAAQEKSDKTGIPMTNAVDRNVTNYAGGGQTGYNKIGMQMYHKGGKTHSHWEVGKDEEGKLTGSKMLRFDKPGEGEGFQPLFSKKSKEKFKKGIEKVSKRIKTIAGEVGYSKQKKRMKKLSKKSTKADEQWSDLYDATDEYKEANPEKFDSSGKLIRTKLFSKKKKKKV